MLRKPQHWPLILFIVLVGISYFHVRMRVDTVLLGYKMSETQSEIVALREKYNALQTELSKLTVESQLSKAAEAGDKKVSKQ